MKLFLESLTAWKRLMPFFSCEDSSTKLNHIVVIFSSYSNYILNLNDSHFQIARSYIIKKFTPFFRDILFIILLSLYNLYVHRCETKM